MKIVPLNALSPTALPTCDAPAMDRRWTGLAPSVSHVESGQISRISGLGAKRVLDLVGATVGLILLSPIMAVIAFLIRYDSQGPALFRQRRLGRRGQPFWIYKFRTMRADAELHLSELEAINESAHGVLFKLRDDPRVTRLGHFLRRTNFDELPQLWNVLRGEMSLVGPRPFQMRDSERLRALDPAAFTQRLEFLPGLTGAWQVGRISSTDSEHLLEFDLDYVQNWSLKRDMRIMYRTVFILIAGFLAKD